MNKGKIPVADYQAFAKEFNPVKYDADQWVQLAREAGMKYIVITAKHHDGFANFDTKASDWNIVKATPYGQDVLKPLAAACRKYGLKLGFYYSQAQDWNNGGAACNGKWDPAQAHDMDDYIDKVAVPQVRELLSNYGEFPAVLWWDTPMRHEPGARRQARRIAQAQAGHHLQRPPRRRFQGRHRNARTIHSRHGLSRTRLGNLHDHERHLGFQELRHQWKSSANPHPQPGGHRQQGRKLSAQRRADQRRSDSRSERRTPQGRRRVDEGQRRCHLRHHRQPLQTSVVGPLHQGNLRRRNHPLPARLQLAATTASWWCPA